MSLPTNLCAELSTFVGRTRELDALAEHVARQPLVTVLGPPGTGKTRLVRELGLRLAGGGHHLDELWFVELGAARDADAVREAIGAALQLALAQRGAGATTQLAAALRARGAVLLILDNFEQVASSAAETVGELLRLAPALRIVVTSRVALQLDGELRFDLEPLDESEAMELFVARARTVRLDAAREPHAEALVRSIVQRLDALPLALELAAARADVLTTAQILERLDRRSELLDRPRTDPQRRFDTLRGAIEWSWVLLGAEERRGLAQCAVFRGGFDLAAAEAVLAAPAGAGAVLELMARLRAHSLVRATSAEDGALLRFDLLETIREFALGSLGGTDGLGDARHRHLLYYLEHATEAARRLHTAGGLALRERALLDLDNYLAAHDFACESQPELGVRLALALEQLMWGRGPYATLIPVLDRAVQATVAGTSLRVRTLRARADVLRQRGDIEEALADSQLAVDDVADLDDPLLHANVLVVHARTQEYRGDHAEALLGFERALELVSATDRDACVVRAHALIGLAGTAHELGDTGGARGHYEAARTSLRGIDAPALRAIIEFSVAVLDLDEGALEAAAGRLATLVRTADLRWLPRLHAFASTMVGVAATALGRFEEAPSAFDAARLGARNVGDQRLVTYVDAWWGVWLAGTGHIEAAQETLRAACQAFEQRGDRVMWRMAQILEGVGELSRAEHEGRSHAVLSALEARLVPPPELDDVFAIDVRLAEQTLRRALRALRGQDRTTPLLVASGGRAFRAPDQRWVSLERRRTLARLLDALVQARVDRPGQAVTRDELLGAGWPGERIIERAGSARVYVAISTLRKLGLAAHVVSTPQGYALDAVVPVVRVREPPAVEH